MTCAHSRSHGADSTTRRYNRIHNVAGVFPHRRQPGPAMASSEWIWLGVCLAALAVIAVPGIGR